MPVNHIVALPISATSHLRQLVHFIFSLINAHPSVIVTILITSSTRATWDRELGATSYDLDGDVLGRWRIVEMDQRSYEDSVPAEVTGIIREIEIMLLTCEGPTLQRVLTGGGQPDKWSARPCLVIPDQFIGAVRNTVRDVRAARQLSNVPVVPFVSTMAIALHRMLNDTTHHGAAEGMMSRYETYRGAEMDKCHAARKAFRFVNNIPLQWPDLPPMFDYEWTPQSENIKLNPGLCRLFQAMWDDFHNADGFICVSDPEIDGASIEAISFTLGVPLIGVGPQLDPLAWDPPVPAAEKQASQSDKAILNFLDNMQALHGPKSVVYISFGTIIWPTLRPDIVDDIIAALIEMRTPFLVATASPDGKVEDEVKAKIQASGLGMVSDWVPQVRVLQHPATLAFVTHCGMGSIMEAILAEVPILAMPFHGDMAALAAHFTQIRRIGIPLNHFSANAGLKLGSGVIVQDSPHARRAELADALHTLRGPGGDSYRQTLTKVKKSLSKSRECGRAKEGLLSLSRWFSVEE